MNSYSQKLPFFDTQTSPLTLINTDTDKEFDAFIQCYNSREPNHNNSKHVGKGATVILICANFSGNLIITQNSEIVWKGLVPSHTTLFYSPSANTMSNGVTTIPAVSFEFPAVSSLQNNHNTTLKSSTKNRKWFIIIFICVAILLLMIFMSRSKIIS